MCYYCTCRGYHDRLVLVDSKASQLDRTVDCLSPLEACMTSVTMKEIEVIKVYLKKFSRHELRIVAEGVD